MAYVGEKTNSNNQVIIPGSRGNLLYGLSAFPCKLFYVSGIVYKGNIKKKYVFDDLIMITIVGIKVVKTANFIG